MGNVDKPGGEFIGGPLLALSGVDVLTVWGGKPEGVHPGKQSFKAQ